MKIIRVLFYGLLTASALIFNQANAQSDAGLFVEPSVHYETGESSVNFPGLGDSSGTSNGYGVGARLGFHVSEVLFAGIDGRYSQTQFKDSSANQDSKSNNYNVGPVIGMQMPNLGLRLWGAYVVDGEMNPEESRGFDVNFEDPTGPRLGAAFRFASLSLDVEYQQLKYGSSTLERVGAFDPNASFDNVNLQNDSWIVSLSFPVEL